MSSGLALFEPGADPLIGKTLAERYQVLRKLGEGGMGAVYEGEHLVIKKRVAIKVLHTQFATTPEIVARFHQEALAATAIGHEHIVEVNDMGRTPDGALFMVLEFLKGRDFADLLEKDAPLSIGRVAHICAQVSDAVQAAHDKGIIHRDLKPENIYLVKRGGDPDFVKVLDFGISKMRDGAGTGGHAQTKTGAVMGTAYYMSPEQAMGKKDIDPRSDVWAMGVILFRALTGEYPFDHEAYPMLIIKICQEPPPRPSSMRSDIPPELEALILRCLDKDPAKRPQSCSELVTALGPFRSMTAILPGTRMSTPGGPVAPAPSGVRPSRAQMPTGPAAFAETLASTPGEGHPKGTSASATEVEAAGISRGAPRWLGIVGVTGATALVVGVGVWWATQPPPVTTTEPVVPTVVDPTPAPEADPAPAGATIDFILSPIDAIALIDGRPVIADEAGDLHVPVLSDDTTIHELRVEARGFRTRIEDLRLSYHQRIVISLDPGSGVDDRRGTAPAVPPPVSGSSSGGRVHHGGSSGAATPVATGSSGGTASPAPSPSPAPAPAASPAPAPEPSPAPAEAPAGVVAPPPRAGLKRLPTTPT